MLMEHSSTRRERKSAPLSNGKDPIDHNRLDDMVGYQLRMAYVAVRRHFEAAMERLNLTQKQAGVLWLIDANGGVSQIALANELGMDRASMMAIVDRLEERGRRRPPPGAVRHGQGAQGAVAGQVGHPPSREVDHHPLQHEGPQRPRFGLEAA